MNFIEQLADSLYRDLEDFPYEKKFNYEVYIDTKNSYDILVNDFLIGSDNGRFKQKIGFFANNGILKSGKQKLQIILYPERLKGEFSKTLTNEDYLEIIVERYIWGKDGWKENKTEILNYSLPKTDRSGNKINYSEKKELIIDLEFDAEVPYSLSGWTEGVVLERKNIPQLKKKLVTEYENIIEKYKSKQFEEVKKKSFLSDYEMIRYFYYPKEMYITKFSDYDSEKEMTFLPLENYDLFFYGDGRLITLRRTDDKYKGDSPVIERYTENGKNRLRIIEFYFYQPQGSDDLILIR